TYARVVGKVDQATFEWRQIETPEWQDLSDLPPYAHQGLLAKKIMCEHNSSPSDVRSILQRLKNPYN
ncbi:MAG: CNP1-like family protein, partial [Saezia sp.]